MPRQDRLHIAGGLYHVMGRGLERRTIFNTHEDREDFLARLAQGLVKTSHQCLAWALMDNHYHLLIRAGVLPLTKLMHPLLTGYAISYNRRHKRVGYLYQNRYESILCNEQSYFLELVRYIHLNPVRAAIINTIEQLDTYPWTGRSILLGHKKRDWQVTEDVLICFSTHQQMLYQVKGWDLEGLIQHICNEFELSPDSLLLKGRNNNISTAKALICYYGCNELAISMTLIAKRLTCSLSAVSRLIKKGHQFCQQTNKKYFFDT